MKASNNMELWTRPANYAGSEWNGYYVFLWRHRDSVCSTRSNFEVALNQIGGEQCDDNGEPVVTVVRENHWAVGWVEWIAIRADAEDAILKADAILDRLEDYPILDEDHFSEVESVEAEQIWANCYSESERLAYIREHRSQFDFDSLADILGCVRGKYFCGYASELIS